MLLDSMSVQKIRTTLSLWCEPNQVYELRAPKVPERGTVSGYFDDFDALAEYAYGVSDIMGAPAVYLTLNPCNPDLKARACNRTVDHARATTSDRDIVEYRRLLIDCDAQRPAQISATDQEHQAAMEKAKAILAFLAEQGWHMPIVADSGNGGHLVYAIGLPNDPASIALVEAVLKALAVKFDDVMVKVDTTVHNPARISKLYGTMVRKGDNLPERPHRLSAILDRPSGLEIVPRDLLEKVAAMCPTTTTTASTRPTATTASTTTARTATTASTSEPTGDRVAWVQSFLDRHQVDVRHIKPDNGKWRQRWVLTRCPFCQSEDTAAMVSVSANGKPGFRCQHNRCSDPRKKWRDFRLHYEPDWKPNRAKNKVARLVEVAVNNCELFMTPDGKPYASIRRGDCQENIDLGSTAFKEWLIDQADRNGMVAGRRVVEDTLPLLRLRARNGKVATVHLRTAQHDGHIYLDLCNGRFVEVSADGWRVVEDCPVRFVRTSNMAAMPIPERGGSWDELWRVVNVAKTERPLVAGFILDCFKAHGPYMTALVGGEQGSTKSTLCRVIRALTDPTVNAPLRRLPRDQYDLSVAATTNAVLGFDNVSLLPQWGSDAIAALNTGMGFSTRKLYSQDEEYVYGAARPVLLNGIPDFAESADLLDRAVKITCPTIGETDRKPEVEVMAAFEAARPRIFGVILDALVNGLKRFADVRLTGRSRMADSEQWVAACELGTDRTGQFVEAYKANREELTALAIDSSPVATALLDWFAKSKETDWTGSATDLLSLLSVETDPVIVKSAQWPKVPHKLSGELRRIAPALRKVGIVVKNVRTKKGRFLNIVNMASDQVSQPASTSTTGPVGQEHIKVNDQAVTSRDIPTLAKLTEGRIPFDLDYELRPPRLPDHIKADLWQVVFRRLTHYEMMRVDPELPIDTRKDGKMSILWKFNNPPAFST